MSVYNGLEKPPKDGEGEISKVEPFYHNTVGLSRSSPDRTCQMCGGPVPPLEEHARAWVRVQKLDRMNRYTLIFCDKDCLNDWVMQGSG